MIDWLIRKKLAKSTLIQRLVWARPGKCLEFLAEDECLDVRKVVAETGVASKKLSHDPEWAVRLEVASNGFELEHFVFRPRVARSRGSGNAGRWIRPTRKRS